MFKIKPNAHFISFIYQYSYNKNKKEINEMKKTNGVCTISIEMQRARKKEKKKRTIKE